MSDLMRKTTALVIDDEESMREGCRQKSEAAGYLAEVGEHTKPRQRLSATD